MKIILYNSTDILETIENCQSVNVIDENNVEWHNGSLNGIKANFVVVEDSLIVNSVADIQEISLQQAKERKMEELDYHCERTILGRFKATVDTVEYSFSNDAEAQSNFKDGMWALENNKASTVKWTAYDLNGNVVRLDLDLLKLSDVNIARLTHQQSQVSKFRDTLEPQVWAATTIEEVEAIVW